MSTQIRFAHSTGHSLKSLLAQQPGAGSDVHQTKGSSFPSSSTPIARSSNIPSEVGNLEKEMATHSSILAREIPWEYKKRPGHGLVTKQQ